MNRTAGQGDRMWDEQPADRPVRVVVMTTDGNGREVGRAVAVEVPVGETIEIGRQGDVQIADDPEDASVSRVALRLRTMAEGSIELVVTNLNGVALHPWGLRTRYLSPHGEPQLITGRVGIRVIGRHKLDHPDVRVYWVLVEGDPVRTGIPRPRIPLTVANTRPVALTNAQREAVETVFGEHLAWPPTPKPVAVTIEAAARRLGVSPTGITERLSGVRKKAQSLGMAQQFGVADPEYVHVLVTHGYLAAPTEPLPAEDLVLFEK